MAIDNDNAIEVEWDAGSPSKTITAGSNATSDEIDLTDTAGQFAVIIEGDNQGSPAAGDYLDVFWLAWLSATLGYTTPGHGIYLGRVDTNTEDPARSPELGLPPSPKGKLYVDSNAASSVVTKSTIGQVTA